MKDKLNDIDCLSCNDPSVEPDDSSCDICKAEAKLVDAMLDIIYPPTDAVSPSEPQPKAS